MRHSLVVIALLIPAAGWAQTTPAPSAINPPNLIDRANAATDQRRAEQARAAAADRANAEAAARAARAAQASPVAGSTLTDGLSGLGSRPDQTAPVSPPRS